MAYVQHQPYDGDKGRWIPIDYRQYWDFARLFRLQFQGLTLVFDSPFVELRDEYADHFIVYRCDSPNDDVFVGYQTGPVVDVFPVTALVMDESRKQYVLREPLMQAWKHWEEFEDDGPSTNDSARE